MAGYQGLLDMLNGGGAGAAGDEFQDGPFSDLLNAMGLRPMGYQDRAAQAAAEPQVTASTSGGYGGGGATSAPAPAPAFGAFGTAPGVMDPITATALPPPTPAGMTPNPELMAMLEQFLKQAPTATGYGPR